VEIVKKASQLEEIAAEERKSWAKMRGDKGKTIETPTAGVNPSNGGRVRHQSTRAHKMSLSEPVSSADSNQDEAERSDVSDRNAEIETPRSERTSCRSSFIIMVPSLIFDAGKRLGAQPEASPMTKRAV
jgi:hypothetical protein